MKVHQYLPSYASMAPLKAEVGSFGELMSLPFVAIWTKLPNRFFRFSRYTHSRDLILLMVDLDEGRTWRVVAFLSGLDHHQMVRGLPEWKSHLPPWVAL